MCAGTLHMTCGDRSRGVKGEGSCVVITTIDAGALSYVHNRVHGGDTRTVMYACHHSETTSRRQQNVPELIRRPSLAVSSLARATLLAIDDLGLLLLYPASVKPAPATLPLPAGHGPPLAVLLRRLRLGRLRRLRRLGRSGGRCGVRM